jgi:hypothetical protein
MNDLLYEDQFVTLDNQAMVFKNYYFPFLQSKRVPLADIARITTPKLGPLMGKWRIWGSSDFVTWFPMDWKRPTRDKIFVAELRGRRSKIGFTVENSARLEKILREKQLLV